MNALRKIQKVTSGSAVIEIPPELDTKYVEIIVVPIEDTSSSNQNLREILLAAPTLTEDEVEEYQRIRNWMSIWNVNGF